MAAIAPGAHAQSDCTKMVPVSPFGAGDQTGATNRITPAVTKAAAAEIQTGKVTTMTNPLVDGVPLFGTRFTKTILTATTLAPDASPARRWPNSRGRAFKCDCPAHHPPGWHCRCTASAMSLRVLLVGSDCDLVAAVELSLSRLADTEVVRATGDAALVEAVAAAAPDVVIVDLARSDPDRLDAIRHVLREQPRPIVMFVDADDPLLMEAAIAAGVSSYNVVGATLPDVQPIVRAAIALFRRYRRIEEELAAARAALAESSVIDKAKARLIRHRRLSEPAAYRLLRRRAMDEGRRIADIAREILATGE